MSQDKDGICGVCETLKKNRSMNAGVYTLAIRQKERQRTANK